MSARTASTLSETLARWYLGLSMKDLPEDILDRTKMHVLDILGLALAGAPREPGRRVREAATTLYRGGDCRILGFGDQVGMLGAALANGTMAHDMEYDDTHNESIVHVANAIVTTAMSVGQTRKMNGAELIAAVAGGNEISCRIGVVAPGRMHKVGYHATGVVGTMATTFVASRLLGLDIDATRHAVGIAGSQAAGIMECWADGTWSKFLHPGFAAQNGITAANIAKTGFTGPGTVFEGRFGYYRSHVQEAGYAHDFERLVSELGSRWESRNISFKPYPNAHFIHSFLDVLFQLMREHGLTADQVDAVTCPIADYMIPVVCEPVAEKIAPASDWHGRVSLQYSLAEALCTGRLDGRSYEPATLKNPQVLDMAKRVGFRVDDKAPPHGRFKGWVILKLKDGRTVEAVTDYNRGSAQLPMSADDIATKFRDNASLMLPPERVDQIAAVVSKLEALEDIRTLVDLCCR